MLNMKLYFVSIQRSIKYFIKNRMTSNLKTNNNLRSKFYGFATLKFGDVPSILSERDSKM